MVVRPKDLYSLAVLTQMAIAGSALSTPSLQLGRGVIGNCDQLEFRVRGTRVKTALSQSNPWSNVPAAGSAELEVGKDNEQQQHLVSWVTSNDEVTEFLHKMERHFGR
jgi:hypothetical protein